MKKSTRSKRMGFLVVGTLAVLTLAGHLLTRGSDALPSAAVNDPATSTLTTTSFNGTSSRVSFSGRLDRSAVLAGGDGRVNMELVLAGAELPGVAARTATDLLIVLDRSGSMGGAKIEYARSAIGELIAELGPQDRLALVAYSSDAELAIPLSFATAEAKRGWRSLVREIYPGGGTNMSRGLDLALDIVGRVRGTGPATRVMLISDGLANEGDSTTEGLTGRAARAARAEVVLSAVGVGEDFNEFLMSAIADAGTGNYYFLQDTRELAAVFSQEFTATRRTVASALEVSIEPAAGVRVVDAAGYPLERRGAETIFRPGSLFAGQERRIWVTLQVDDPQPGRRPLGRFRTAYAHADERRTVELEPHPFVSTVDNPARFLAAVDKDAWASSVIEEDYGRLRQEVAGYVREGRREEALQEIAAYQSANRAMNEAIQSDEVNANLRDVAELEAEVEDAFQGTDQGRKQNVLSKQQQAAGRDARRVGSKVAPKVKKP
ncbi:MAG: VWA domain-containing protein [bacterium]|nr:VWA domain-containing protein [bacterium]